MKKGDYVKSKFSRHVVRVTEDFGVIGGTFGGVVVEIGRTNMKVGEYRPDFICSCFDVIKYDVIKYKEVSNEK